MSAEDLDYEETLSDLHEALETDLSGFGWPAGTQAELESVFQRLELLVGYAEGNGQT